MARHVSNMNELAKALQPTLLKMTDQLAERVYETLNFFFRTTTPDMIRQATRGRWNFCIQR